MSKHPKRVLPSDADLSRNPLIGGSKGARMGGITPDDIAAAQGTNTIEGDIENDTNPQGGIDKGPHRAAHHPRRPLRRR